MKSLDEWLDTISQVHNHSVELTLERIRTVAESMQLLPVPYKVITVAGTNGKGTTASLLETIYRYAGFKTGLYTSPHLLKFNERITVNGEQTCDENIIQAFEKIDAARGKVTLTYFEYAVLAALYCFQHIQLDIVILEIGMGGRLDACNIVNSDVAVITTVELDHTEWLGSTREKIGVEKAGIFRSHVPAICGDLDCPQSVINRATKLKCPLFIQQQHFCAVVNKSLWDWHCKTNAYTDLPIPDIPVQNASTALMAVQCLQQQLSVPKAAIEKALKQIKVPGRFQFFQLHCPVILDVAHNVAAANFLAEKLRQQPCEGKTIGVFSVLQDKDVSGILAQMQQVIHYWHYAPLRQEQALSQNHLAAAFDYVEQRKSHATIDEALDAALVEATPNDRIVVFGSFYVVAAVLPYLQQRMISS